VARANSDMAPLQKRIAVVFSGGLGLGAYQAGAYQRMTEEGLQPYWIAGSSVGAVNGALIAGSDEKHRIDSLRAFWSAGDLWFRAAALPGYLGHTQNWLSVFHTRLFGASGHFRPRVPTLGPFRSLYDLAPMKDRLERLVDFGRLNSGEVRFSVAATDIETGELVVFDTAKRDEISIDHLMASCGFLPEFAPVEIGGRLLGDGGLSANAPIEALGNDASNTLVLVIDLFARDGERPRSLEDALARKNDIMFGNQTVQRLELLAAAGRVGPVVLLSYRPLDEEAGPEKTFDLSRATISGRWTAGAADMDAALERIRRDKLPPLTVIRRGSLAPTAPKRAGKRSSA
jgi:NTE family protein